MCRRSVIIGLLAISMVVMFRSEVKAQYSYLGGGWDVCDEFGCSYHHKMKFKVPGNVVNQGTIFFLSDTVWYDNQVVCINKGGNITFSPGLGHVTTEGFVQIFLQTSCTNRTQGGECAGEVVYFNSVAELQSNQDLLDDCRAAVGNNTPPPLTAQQCFLRFFNLETFHCRNRNDTPIEIRTKGVCTTATARTCTDPTNPSTCTEQITQGVRYTFPNFNQNVGDSFAQQLDDRCVACVADPVLNAASCKPQP